MGDEDAPEPAELKSTLLSAMTILPDTSIQIPLNLIPNIREFIRLGIDDLGGLSPVTPDFVNPEKAWPKLEKLKSEIAGVGYELRERLPIYPEYVRRSEFMSQRVEDVVEELSDDEGYRRR